MDALQLYAVAHPEVSLTLQVTGDDHLSENNGCYTIAGGAAQRIARCSTIETILTINQLTELLFEESPLEMPLMLL